MFNSIKKDDRCRKLVKKNEILRLQNKILAQAMSILDPLPTRVKEKGSNITSFYNASPRKSDRSLLWRDANTKINEKKPSLIASASPKLKTSTLPDKKLSVSLSSSSPLLKKATTSLLSSNLEIYKSNFHLFAKKKLKAEAVITRGDVITYSEGNENPLLSNSTFPKSKAKIEIFPQYCSSFSLSLLALAKSGIISLPRNSSKGRIKNRCIETGRSHSVLRFCKLSRILLRDNASKALISGLSKASW